MSDLNQARTYRQKPEPTKRAEHPSRRHLAAYFLRLGALGFGGPVALVGYMHRDLVESRGWIGEEEYREGMALAQLSPGPLAAQLCFYLGYIRGGVTGAIMSGLAFVAPSFLIVVALGWAYLRYGGISWMQAVFYGVGASVIGLIAKSAYGLARKTMGRDALLWGILLVVAVATAITGRESVSLIVAGGVVVWLVRAPPAVLRRTGTAGEGASAILLLQILGFFAYAGTFVFGSGLAIVPFLHGGVVLEHRWLTERQFLDAVAVAFITPRPGGDHHRVHRLSRGRPGRCLCGRGGDIPPGVSLHGDSRPVLPSPREASLARCGGGGGNSGRHRSHRRRGIRAGPRLDRRSADRTDRAGRVRAHLAQVENSRSGDRASGGAGRAGGKAVRRGGGEAAGRGAAGSGQRGSEAARQRGSEAARQRGSGTENARESLRGQIRSPQ